LPAVDCHCPLPVGPSLPHLPAYHFIHLVNNLPQAFFPLAWHWSITHLVSQAVGKIKSGSQHKYLPVKKPNNEKNTGRKKEN